MNRMTRIATAATGLFAVTAVTLAAAPAHADIDRHGTWAGAQHEFSVDREGRGFEVSLDIDNAQPGSRWRITLRHDGKRVLRTVRTADHEGDVDVETWRKNTAGKDTFKVKVEKIGTKGSAKHTIVTR